MTFCYQISKKSDKSLPVSDYLLTFAAQNLNIRGAKAFAEAEKIPIEPDTGNAVGGKKYESNDQQQKARDASCDTK